MRSFWSDPYLWIHLAGLAALPIWLELCFLGLAVGDPIFPVWLELAFVAISGIAPILWMQWQRPFYIFSLLAIALKPEKLTLSQRQLLTRFKSPQNRLLAVAVAVSFAIVLRQLYIFAPIGAAAVPFSLESRGLGLLVAAIAFLGCNLFLQVPISVASVMLTSDAAFASTEPYPLEQISQHFTSLGLPVSQLLPEFLENRAIASPVIPSPTKSESAVEAVDLWADDVVPPIEEVTPSPTLELVAAESVVEESTEAISEVNGIALEELVVEQEALEIEAETTVEAIEALEIEAETTVEAIADISTEVVDLPEVNTVTESDSEVEQAPSEDLRAIARIDQQSVDKVSSAESSVIEIESEEPETTSDSLG
ncbi:low-complexity tail membrane protein [Leptolyngbyaceae cyanobacterium UHCC 1019]